MSELEDVKRTESGVFYDLESNRDALYDKIHNGERLTIGYDSTAESPRDWDNNNWSLSCFHKKYDLGDEDCRLNIKDYDSWDEYGEALREEYDIVEMVPLYLLDHSHLSLSIVDFNDRWDSGQIGFAFLTAENQKDIAKTCERSDLHELSLDLLKDELSVYEGYLNGETYFVRVENVNTGKMIDVLGGLYGTDFVANGLYYALPEEFVEDVRKSLPMYFPSLEKDQSKSFEQTQEGEKRKRVLERLIASDRHPERGEIKLAKDSLGNDCFERRSSNCFERWFDNGQLRERCQLDENGRANGLVEQWYPNGQPCYRANYKDNDLNGLEKTWYENGQLQRCYRYTNGVRDGACQEWREDGALVYDRYYDAGMPIAKPSHEIKETPKQIKIQETKKRGGVKR